jgi:protein-disulfide isomerase
MIEEQVQTNLWKRRPNRIGPCGWRRADAPSCFVPRYSSVPMVTLFGADLIQQLIPSSIQTAELQRYTTFNNTMGDPNAPVHIIEYGDFQCPYCLKFWKESEPQLIKEYVNTGIVYFEYRSLGAFLGEESGWAAEGAYCAGDQDKFWEYHDTLYVNWNGENTGNYSKDRLVQFAESLDLDMQTFESCLREGWHTSTVEQDAADASAAGVRATPTFFINGFMVEGAQPFHVLKEYIEEALRQKRVS